VVLGRRRFPDTALGVEAALRPVEGRALFFEFLARVCELGVEAIMLLFHPNTYCGSWCISIQTIVAYWCKNPET